MVNEFFTVAALPTRAGEISNTEKSLGRSLPALPGPDRCGKITAGRKPFQPQLAFAKSPRREMPMAKPHIRCVDRALTPLRGIDAREAHRSPAIFDSSKHNGARQKAARDIAHRQIRAAQFSTMLTGFETAEALQRCQPAAATAPHRTTHSST
jgi:hypothetical protein